MDLWIRSQNKEILKKVHYLKISRNYEGTTLEGEAEYSYSIFDINENEEFLKELGSYKTKKRTLEVLNEIHQRLLDLQLLELNPAGYKGIKRSLDCVYQMPEK